MALLDLLNQYQVNRLQGMDSPTQATGSKTSGSSNAKLSNALVTSSVIEALGQIGQGFINAARVKNAAKFNAGLAEIEGRMIRVQADLEIARIRKEAGKMYATQRSRYAKAGVVPDVGSPAAIELESLKEAEQDAIITDINANYMQGQKNLESELYKMQGTAAKYGALQNTYKSILNLGGNIAMIKGGK